MTDAARARQLHAVGDTATAALHYARAISANPSDLRLKYDYAALLMQLNRPHDAAPLLREIRNAVPDDAQLLLPLIACLRASGQIAEALRMADEATRLMPGNAAAWMLKGSLEVRAGSLSDAETSLRRALSLSPGFAEAWHYLGEAFHRQQRWHEAAHAYGMASAEQPGEIFNIAMCLEQAGDLDAARDGYMRASAIYLDRPDVLLRLAQVEARLCEFSSEVATLGKFEKAMARGLPANGVLEAFPLTYLPLEASTVMAALTHYMEAVTLRAAEQGDIGHRPQTAMSGRRIRIGYLSPDFGMHAVGQLVSGVIGAHDRARFEVFAYSLQKHTDPVAAEIREKCEHFIDCEELAVVQIVERIRRDGIDVLVDLSGPTVGARLEVLALRPAPLQIGWLGFIHAQQAPWLDGILLDEHVQPSDAPWPYSDRVIRLPTSLFPASPSPPGHRHRERFGLPEEGRPVLASFNNSYKLDAPLAAAWIDILRQAPTAILMLYLPRSSRKGFLRHWQAMGGDASSLMIVDALAPADQADRMASCDLMLDAFRYQGGATTLDAIASGLPVLSRIGRTPPSRLGASINRALGLDELVVADTEAYIRRAAWLANHPAELEALRHRVITAMHQTTLFDPRRSAADLEDAYERLLREKGVLP